MAGDEHSFVTARSRSQLVYRNCYFNLVRTSTTGRSFWRCRERPCPGTGTLSEGRFTLNRPHDHKNSPETVIIEAAKERMKKRAAEEAVSLHHIFEEERDRVIASVDYMHFPPFRSWRSSLQRARQAALPPKCTEEPPLKSPLNETVTDSEHEVTFAVESMVVEYSDAAAAAENSPVAATNDPVPVTGPLPPTEAPLNSNSESESQPPSPELCDTRSRHWERRRIFAALGTVLESDDAFDMIADAFDAFIAEIRPKLME